MKAACVVLLFLALHCAALAWMGDRTGQASLTFLIAAPALAGAACVYRGARDGWEGWLPLALSMLCWSAGMAATMVGQFVLGVATEFNLSMMLFVLYGVPLIFALASLEGDAWYVRMVDAGLAAALGYLFFVYVAALSTFNGTDAGNVGALRMMFDIENIYVALFAVARFFACDEARRRYTFRALAVYAFAYLLVAGYTNHYQNETDFGGFSDAIIGAPFLILGALAVVGRSAGRDPVAWRPLVRIVRAGSAFILPASVLIISVLLLRHDAGLAVAGCIFATLGYGLRSMLSQLRSFEEQDRLERLSHVDALTGIANRRMFDEMLGREAARGRRASGDIALLMVDIDHFKQLNDNYGHPTGDKYLRAVANVLARCARRGTDLVARFGGEEFAVLLPGTGAQEAADIAEAMRSAVEGLALPSSAAGGVVTVSIGVAHAEDGAMDPQTLLDRADASLYAAKRAGRNRVVLEHIPEWPAAQERPLQVAK